MNHHTILIADDEPSMRKSLLELLREEGYTMLEASDGETAVALTRNHRPAVVLMDINLPGLDGLAALREIKRSVPDTVVIVFTAYGTSERAIEAMKAGAYDYLEKPFELDEFLLIIRRSLQYHDLLGEVRQLRSQVTQKHQETPDKSIIGSSGQMQEIFKLIGRVAPTDTTVLIQGESGTGKELIADALQRHSLRTDRPFIKVNCGALPETLLESEIFGHEKGAFTGAVAQRKGRFEQADGGSIFLDEIGDLSPALQVKLLRVLQERQFERVGGNKTISANVRVMAATHRDLERALREGTFRDDLYYRLNVVTIQIPPLRERREDIPPLLDHFLRKFAEKNRREVTGLTAAARDALLKYDYPGNVRELENIVERAVLLCRGRVIDLEDLPTTVRPGQRSAAEPLPKDLPGVLGEIERQAIQSALDRSGGVQTQAASELGISERVLRYKMKKYGLEGRSG